MHKMNTHARSSDEAKQPHRARRRRRNQIITAAAATCLFSTAAAVFTTSAHASTTGGYLAHPQSRNYIAYKSSPIVPSATHPESLLAEEEPTPQSLNSGQRCGVVDGGERDYNRPMSRAGSRLPINIQEVYVSGSEIEVIVKSFGVKDGGHFEFHICALEYPQEPTEECFQQHPLTFVKDHYYGAVKDDLHPERAYVPFKRAFRNTDSSMARIESEEDGMGTSMMEFKYTYKLPESTDLSMDLDELAHHELLDSGVTSFSVQVPVSELSDEVIEADNEKWKPFDGKIQMSGLTGINAVLISAMVTDGRGTTTIVSMNESPVVHENGPTVEATAICTFGEISIYGQGISTIPEKIKRICGLIEETSMVEASSPGGSGSDSDGDDMDMGDNLPPFPITKYALLRWNYKTARSCYHSGYDTYSWPKEWGQWQPQSDGECADNESQDEYWNCAEVIILKAKEDAAGAASTSPPLNAYSIVAVNDDAITQVNEAIKIDVFANDEVSGNVKPRIKDTSGATNGYCEVSDDEILYTPKLDFSGWDRCSYTACVANDTCDEAFIKIKVLEDDFDPITRPDNASVIEGSSVDIDVIENDDGNSLEISSASSPIHGSVEVVNNLIRYTSTAGFTGTDSFTYSACDNANRCDSAGVVVSVTAEVFAENDSVATNSVPILIDVILNDRSSSGSTSLAVTHVTDGKHGSCSITASNKVKYVPNVGYTGWDQCDYTVCVGDACDQARVEINILPPIESMQESLTQTEPEKVYAQDDHVVTFLDKSIEVDVVSNDFVKGMGYLEIMHTGGSDNGKCEITIDNKILYIPENGFAGSDKCDYIICHESNLCDEGILQVDVIQPEVRSSLHLSTSKTSDGIIIPPSADATIMKEYPNENFGNATTLFVSNASTRAGVRDSMLKFHTSSIDESVCIDGIKSATVSVYSLTFAIDGGTLITTSNKFWAEMEVTWNDAPAGDGIVLIDMGSVNVNTWYDIDVSSAVTLGEPLSLRIVSRPNRDSIALYASKDHADKSLQPVLKIECAG